MFWKIKLFLIKKFIDKILIFIFVTKIFNLFYFYENKELLVVKKFPWIIQYLKKIIEFNVHTIKSVY